MGQRVTHPLCFVFLALLLMTGCAGGISSQARSQVTHKGPFSQIQGDPVGYAGSVVHIGGKIIDHEAKEGLSELTVLHLPLDWQGRPGDEDRSEGRYILCSREFLDPALYKKDLLLSVVGRITGVETRGIGGFDYPYPVIEPIEMKLWPKQETGLWPRVHFGIGVGIWK